MRFQLPTASLLFLLLVTAGSMTGCSSQAPLQLGSGDIKALKRVYEASPWQFRQSTLEFQVHQSGAPKTIAAVEITVEGEVVQKDSSRGGPLLLPVALVRELPDYLKGTDLSNQATVELQAYKIAGGLWCVTALVPFNSPQEQSPTQTSPESKRVQLQVLLVSPDFERKLPLLIPAAQSGTSVDLHITLPQGASFESQDISSVNQSTGQTTKLTVLPLSLTGGAVRAAGKLVPESAAVWDFSQVTYTNPSNTYQVSKLLRRSFLSSILVTIGLTLFYWLEIYRRERQIKQKYLIKTKDEYELQRELYRRTYRQRRVLYWFIGFSITLIVVATVYVVLVEAQGNDQPVPNGALENVAALGDFGMTVIPDDAMTNKVTVALDFIPLTNTTPQGMGEVGIGTGDNNDAEMENVKVTPSDEHFKFINLNKKQARFPVPVSNIPSTNVLAVLSDPQFQIERVRVTDSLQAALNNKGNLVRVEYVLTKAQDMKDRIGGWLHRFPFEYKSMTIPIKLYQPAILSKIELPKQSEDFTAVISTKGIYDAKFNESNTAYQLDLGRRESRVTIPAGGEVILEATFRRTWFQRLLLIIGPILLAVIGGWFLGFIASLPSSNQLGVIIGGIGVLSLPFLMRSSVFSTYSKLPNVLSGQIPTIFDLIFLFSWIVYAFLAWRVWNRRKRKPRPF